MLLTYTKILNLPVFELQNESKIAEISEIIWDNQTLKVYGLILKNGWTEKNKKVVSEQDIVEFSKEGIAITNDDAILPIKEAVRLKTAIDQENTGIDQKVVTKSGQNVGRVFDILFDSQTLTIRKLYIKSLFHEKIIPIETVIAFEGKTIIIKDDFQFARLSASVETIGI